MPIKIGAVLVSFRMPTETFVACAGAAGAAGLAGSADLPQPGNKPAKINSTRTPRIRPFFCLFTLKLPFYLSTILLYPAANGIKKRVVAHL